MRARILPLAFFLLLSLGLILFSQKISYPFLYFSNLLSNPRTFLYNSVRAAGKPSQMDLLTQENVKLRVQLVGMNALKKDNFALRSQFQDTIVPSQKLLPAKIIGFKGSLDDPITFIIDQGQKSGVKKGMAVIFGSNLVGKTETVEPFASEVKLTTNKEFSTLGVTSDNNSSGVITGQEDFILFNNVVITDTLPKNGTVVTKGEIDKNGIGIPKNFIIGKIISINKSETEPFQSAIIKTLINFQKLTTVFIVK